MDDQKTLQRQPQVATSDVVCDEMLKVGDIRKAGDEYLSDIWRPIPEDRIGLPVFEGTGMHRSRSHTDEMRDVKGETKS